MDDERTRLIAERRVRIALAALAALTRDQHASVQPPLFDQAQEHR